MGDKLAAALYGCRGECCRNPQKVCFHQRKCDHHTDELRAQKAADKVRMKNNNGTKRRRPNQLGLSR